MTKNNCDKLSVVLKNIRKKKLNEFLKTNNLSKEKSMAFYELHNKDYRAALRLFKLDIELNGLDNVSADIIKIISQEI